MKKPVLKNFNNEVLILLSKQKNDKDFDNEVRGILLERYSRIRQPYFKVYFNYTHSNGVQHLVYGDILATHLIDGGYTIDEEVLDELLPNLSVENIWELSKSENDLIREKSRDHLFAVMDLYEKEVVTVKEEKCKVLVKDNIICFKRKGE
jgi:hypothetical protein